ncbi:hypothetical protein RYX36_011653, partial [Vicia faba]
FSFGVTLLVFLSYNTTELKDYERIYTGVDEYPFWNLRNLWWRDEESAGPRSDAQSYWAVDDFKEMVEKEEDEFI